MTDAEQNRLMYIVITLIIGGLALANLIQADAWVLQ